MVIALGCVTLFVAGWVTGRWDFVTERREGFAAWLRGPRLLALCVCLVFAGTLYVQHTPPARLLLAPALEHGDELR